PDGLGQLESQAARRPRGDPFIGRVLLADTVVTLGISGRFEVLTTPSGRRLVHPALEAADTVAGWAPDRVRRVFEAIGLVVGPLAVEHAPGGVGEVPLPAVLVVLGDAVGPLPALGVRGGPHRAADRGEEVPAVVVEDRLGVVEPEPVEAERPPGVDDRLPKEL